MDNKPLLVVIVAVVVAVVLVVTWLLMGPGDDAPTPTITDTRKPGSATTLPPSTGVSMYHRLGHANLLVAVDQFYHRVLGDDRLRHYFAHMDHHSLAQLRRHQAALLGQVLGGPVRFEMSELADAHRHLRIDHDAYWLAVGHLGAVLTGLRVERDIVLHLLKTLYDVADHIVHAPTAAGRAS